MSKHTAKDYLRFFCYLIFTYIIMTVVLNMGGYNAFWAAFGFSTGLYLTHKKKKE
jgi:hypothetical protein